MDFVDWAPGEPNNMGPPYGAVALDLRGHQGIMSSVRNGEWNDDSKAETYKLYPLCEKTIVQATPGGVRSWGAGSHASFNLRVCIDGTDNVFFQVCSPR